MAEHETNGPVVNIPGVPWGLFPASIHIGAHKIKGQDEDGETKMHTLVQITLVYNDGTARGVPLLGPVAAWLRDQLTEQLLEADTGLIVVPKGAPVPEKLRG